MLLVMGKKKKKEEHGEVINYTLITLSHYKESGILPNSVAGEKKKCSVISPCV
jgi:hypothetical protein